MKRIAFLPSLLGLLVIASGCVSTVSFKVGHDRLKDPPAIRTGTLAVKPFVDTRPGVTNAMQIGGKWDKAKPVYLAKQQRPVADIVTDSFKEALEKVGYTVQSQPSPDEPVLEGDLSEFWLKDNWGGAFCTIAVSLQLRRGENGQVLWQKQLHSYEDDLVIIPNAMQAAMNSILASAMTEFSSQSFADAVAGPK